MDVRRLTVEPNRIDKREKTHFKWKIATKLASYSTTEIKYEGEFRNKMKTLYLFFHKTFVALKVMPLDFHEIHGPYHVSYTQYRLRPKTLFFLLYWVSNICSTKRYTAYVDLGVELKYVFFPIRPVSSLIKIFIKMLLIACIDSRCISLMKSIRCSRIVSSVYWIAWSHTGLYYFWWKGGSLSLKFLTRFSDHREYKLLRSKVSLEMVLAGSSDMLIDQQAL